jgi:hypothetical protein
VVKLIVLVLELLGRLWPNKTERLAERLTHELTGIKERAARRRAASPD